MKFNIIYYLTVILSLSILTSCDNWLDISPRTEVRKENVFEEPSGFRDALTGVYIKMAGNSLYGGELTYGNIERLAMHWDEASQSEWVTYNYASENLRIIFSQWFFNLYSVIADVNNILAEIDSKKDIFEPGWYELIKGELLGIRAYCHLDLLRLWGPVPGRIKPGKVLPYARVISVQPHPHIPYNEYIKLLEEDLNEAENLMKEWDPIYSSQMNEYGSLDGFWDMREIRMNYNAVCALKARFYLWTGNKEEANRYAWEVLYAGYSLGTMEGMNATNSDYSFNSEHIFAVDYKKMAEMVERSFTEKSGGFSKQQADVELLFAGGSGTFDIRFQNMWQSYDLDNTAKKFVIKKYWQPEDQEEGRIPLIRLSEMYFIAMETGTLEEASELMWYFYPYRGLEPFEFGTEEELRHWLVMEYNREFYAEGQAFYAYKRLYWEDILWSFYPGSEGIYILPMPDGEIL